MAIAIPSGRVRFATFEVDLRSGELHKQALRSSFTISPFKSWPYSWNTLASW